MKTPGCERAFIFDMDGVIADTHSAYLQSFNNTMERFGIKIGEDEWISSFPGSSLKYIVSTVMKNNNIEPEEEIDVLVDQWKAEYEKVVRTARVKPIKGFLEFNKKINELNISKIIATGSPVKNVILVMSSFGLGKEFGVVSSEDVGKDKPEPDVFLAAARRMGKEPVDCIVFEDSFRGIRAAKKAGMKCVALTFTFPRTELEKEGPDLIIDDYTQIRVEDLLGL